MSKKIFVVDDDKDITDLMEAALKASGFECMVSNTSDGVLQRVRAEKPDLIILDIMMPEMDGTEINIHLKEDYRTKSIPVIFLTGLIEKSEEQSDTSKKDIILAKPFSVSQLLTKIKEVLKS